MGAKGNFWLSGFRGFLGFIKGINFFRGSLNFLWGMGTIKFSFRKYGLNVFFKSNSFFFLWLCLWDKSMTILQTKVLTSLLVHPLNLRGWFFLDSLRRDFRSGLQERFCNFVPLFCFDEEILRKNMTIWTTFQNDYA